MISSNGGTWSNIKSDANNLVKTFKFAVNDIVICDYDPIAKTITFSKHGTTETYSLDFNFIEGDPLHPCCLFYYLNDEVEFLSDYKKEK